MRAKLVTRTVVLLTLAAPAHADPDWRVVRDELCLDYGAGDPTCHQVWVSGKNVQLRRDGAPPEDGVLH